MEVVLDSRPPEQVDDVEVIAYFVKLCRAATTSKGADILHRARQAFAGIDEARLKSCAASAATKLMAQGGYTRPERKKSCGF